MKFVRNQLIARGYWNEADDGTGGSAGGAATDDIKDQDTDSGDNKGGEEAGKKDESGDGGDDEAKPSESEAKLLKEVMQKKEKLREAQDSLKNKDSEVAKLKEELKKFDGIDLEQVKELIKHQKETETRKLEQKGEWDKLKAQMVEQHQSELKSVKEQLEQVQSELKSKDGVINNLTIGHAFDSSKFISDNLTLTPTKARIVYGEYFDIDGDKVVAYDKPKSASDRTMLVNGEGNPLKFEEAISKIIDGDPDRDHLIRSKMKPGADSKTASGKKPEIKENLYGQSRIEKALSAGKK